MKEYQDQDCMLTILDQEVYIRTYQEDSMLIF